MANKVFLEINWKVFRKLDASLVQAWIYGWTNCDAIGLFEYDEDYARVDLNKKSIGNDFDKLGNFGVLKLGNNKYLFKDFIAVNYVHLKENYNPHKPAFRALDKDKLRLNSYNNGIDLTKLSSYPQAWFKLEDEDKDEDKEEDVLKNKSIKLLKGNLFPKIISPWQSAVFEEAWLLWKKYKKEQHKFTFKSETSEQGALSDLAKISKNDEATAIQIINQSIAKGWNGLFELKDNPNKGTNDLKYNFV